MLRPYVVGHPVVHTQAGEPELARLLHPLGADAI